MGKALKNNYMESALQMLRCHHAIMLGAVFEACLANKHYSVEGKNLDSLDAVDDGDVGMTVHTVSDTCCPVI